MQKFSGITLGIFLFLFSFINTAEGFDGEYKEITRSEKINKALDSLKNTSAKWVIKTVKGNNLSGRPIRIMFRKLEKMNPAYKTFEALTCVDSTDKIYIFINSKHKDAPVEAIATLLTHEVLHQDAENSIAEETKAWSNEAIYWTEFTAKNPSLANAPGGLVKRLNILAAIYRKQGTSGIHKKVMSIHAYKNLEMASAGFDY